MKRLMMAVCSLLLAGAAVSGELPERILSGYTGMFLGKPTDHVERMIHELGSHGFNSIEVKIQQDLRSLELAPYKAELARLVKLANQKGLMFQIYLYPVPYDGVRRKDWPEHACLPAPVDARGRAVENIFNLTDPAVWKQLFAHARQFVRLRGEIPFATLKFDIETIARMYSYDDVSWRKFCAANAGFAPDAPAAERSGLLAKAGASERYQAFFEQEVEKAVRAFADSLHQQDPDLILGYMPAHIGWISDVFNRSLATDRTPAIVDSWDMYNGTGFTEKTAENARRIRKMHLNNRVVSWLRPDSYELEDITVSAYHAAAKCGGYSIWVLSMLDNAMNGRQGYRLPAGRTAAGYFDAFQRANEAVRRDIREGTLEHPSRIPWRRAKSMVASLDLSGLNIPRLVPAGSGIGKPRRLVLRDQQTVFIYAQAGEPVKIALSHMAGQARPTFLHYALLDDRSKVLREEAVPSGSREVFSVTAPHAGIYALVVSGGKGGQAWYGVEVFSAYYAVDVRRKTYFFGPQTIYVPGRDAGNPELLLNMQPEESHIRRINGGKPVEAVRRGRNPIALPDGIVKIEFTKSAGSWSQNFFFSFPGGKIPYIYGSPEGRLVPAK